MNKCLICDNLVKDYRRKFCSQECYRSTYIKKCTKYKCTFCNKRFKDKKINNHQERYFCNNECFIAYKKENKKPKYCKHCNVQLKSNTIKCCDNCNPNKKDWSKIFLIDYKKHYGSNLTTYHSRLRSLARSIYKKSNKPKYCVNCKYNLHYEVCHIKDVRNFDGNATIAEINDLDNLVALCRNCHWEFDKGYLKL